MRFHCVGVAAAAVLLASCGSTWPSESLRDPSLRGELGFWTGLTDYQLLDLIAESDGRVFIGFRDAFAIRPGLLPPPAGPESVAAAKEFLRSWGVEIEREFTLIPGAVARMNPWIGVVRAVRYHPNVEYIEAIPATGGSGSRELAP